MNDCRRKDSSENGLKWLAILSIAAGILVILLFSFRLWIYGYRFYGEIDNSISSQVGSFIGGVVGPLWTLATFFILYLALTKQSKQIAEQIKEQRETKFEATFFNLIRTQQEITNSIRIEIEAMHETYDYRGRDYFLKAKRDLELIYKYLLYDDYESVFGTITILENELSISRYKLKEADYKNAALNGDPRDVIKQAYKIFFNVNHIVIGHYFRHLYHILKFIDDAKKKEINRHKNPAPELLREIELNYSKYASFVQAQMSSSELFLLFYNQIYFPKMGNLVKDYDLLENLAYEDLIIESHKEFYETGLKSREEIAAD